MNTIKRNELPNIGAELGSGFFAGLITFNGDEYAIVVSPKADGESEGAWGKYGVSIPGTNSCYDGLANTIALAKAGRALAASIRSLRIGDHDDWYLPSRDELEVCYRNLKPTSTKNYCSFRDGDNASSVPVGYPYTEQSPTQTSIAQFQDDGEQAFNPACYWSSTQYSAYTAFCQVFDDGGQCYGTKHDEFRARAVRRILVIQ